MVTKTVDQMKLGEYIPTQDTENRSFQEDPHGNIRILVEGETSEWKNPDEIAILKAHSRTYIGVTDSYQGDLPKRCALKVEVVDEDGDMDFYKFKIIDLIEDTVLDRDDVEDLLQEPLFEEEEYTFNIKESKLEGFVKIAMTVCGHPSLSGRIMTKEEIEEYLRNTLLPEEFEVINEDGEKINAK